MRTVAALLIWSSAAVASEPASPPPVETATAVPVDSTHRVSLTLGSSHWFGATFGSPDGLKTPAVMLGVRPAIAFLEVRARYVTSLVDLPLPNDSPAHVGFATLEVVLERSAHLTQGQSIELFAGPLGMLCNARGVSGGFGLVLGAQYLFATSLPGHLSLGVTATTRGIYYQLPRENLNLITAARRDVQVDLGLVVTAF